MTESDARDPMAQLLKDFKQDLKIMPLFVWNREKNNGRTPRCSMCGRILPVGDPFVPRRRSRRLVKRYCIFCWAGSFIDTPRSSQT